MVKSWQNDGVPRGTILDKNMLDAQVRSTIGQYNKSGKLMKPIQFSEVAQYLVHLQPKQAMTIVSGLEGKEGTISDPTAWICKAAKKYAAQRFESGAPPIMEAPMGMVRPMSGMDMGGKGQSWGSQAAYGGKNILDVTVRSAIGTLNKNPALQSPVKFDMVAPLLSQISPQRALEILGQLEPKISTVKDPTGWITNAANRAISSGGFAGSTSGKGGFAGGQQQAWGGGALEQIIASAVSEVMGQKYGKGGSAAIGGSAMGGAVGGAPSVGKMIGAFNKSGKLQQVIQYSEVAPLLDQLDPSQAAVILRSLEGKEAMISNPTAWLAKAARKYGAM